MEKKLGGMPMGEPTAARMRRAAACYFDREENRPYSMQELLAALGVDYATLCGWEAGEDPALAKLSREVRARVAAEWEKGQMTASLATYLHRYYLGGAAQPAQEPEGLELTVRVLDDEA
ncbi:MAG: hypothetical protein RRY21_06350 [Oscillospiraceae bacterium]